MRKALLAFALAPFLFLASCVDITEIQRITTQICGFVPTAVQVASWFPIPYTVPAAAIAQAICTAVATQVPLSSKRRLARSGAQTAVTVNVNGQTFVVNGYFVR